MAALSRSLWSLVAHAQQPAKLPTIGFLGTTTPSVWKDYVPAFVQRLRELGWVEGRTVAIEYRWAEGRNERFGEIAAEFARLKVDVIVTSGGAGVAAKQATSTIPIVLALANDPVGSGLAASLARPGGNVTGLSLLAPDLAGKRLETLRQVLPDVRRLAILGNAGYPAAVVEMVDLQATARKLGLETMIPEVRRAEDMAPPLSNSRVVWTRFTFLPTHSSAPTKFASTPWRSQRNCRRCTAPGITSKAGGDVLWTQLRRDVPPRG